MSSTAKRSEGLGIVLASCWSERTTGGACRDCQFRKFARVLHLLYRESVGGVFLINTNLDLEDDMDIVGDLECSSDGCPATKAAQSTLFQMEVQQMCPAADGPPSGGSGDVCRASVRACR